MVLVPPEGANPELRAQPGQNTVEFALTVPIFLFWLLVSIQLAIVVVQQYSLMRVTRETTRWLAIRPDTIDSNVTIHAKSNPLSLDPNRITSVAVDPPCPTLNGAGRCDLHAAGSVVSVTVQYNMSNQIFLPTTFGFPGGLSASIPTSLPPYKVSVTVE